MSKAAANAAEQLAVQAMRDIAKLPENCRCADCDSKDPDWTSINLGIFICIKCAGIHRNLGVHHSKVRSIELDTNCWDEDMINFMKSHGNERARARFERRAPVFYVRPKEYDLAMVRERWIRAKYEKRLFVAEGDTDDAADSSNGSAASAANSSSSSHAPRPSSAWHDPATFVAPERALEGWLFKENKKLKWQKRWFLLWGRELHYFKDAGDSYEKGRIDVTHCKILIPDCSGSSAVGASMASSQSGAPAGHRFLFELVSTQQDRAYPLAAESEEEMFHWLHAIRRAIIFYTTIATPEEKNGMTSKQADIKIPFARLPGVTKKGLLSKQGGAWSSWNKRYFVLAKDVLYYFKQQPADADLPEGGICLDGADIASGEDKLKRKLVFTILTPDRTYFIQANSEAEMTEWMATLQRITDVAQKRRMVDFADVELKG